MKTVNWTSGQRDSVNDKRWDSHPLAIMEEVSRGSTSSPATPPPPPPPSRPRNRKERLSEEWIHEILDEPYNTDSEGHISGSDSDDNLLGEVEEDEESDD